MPQYPKKIKQNLPKTKLIKDSSQLEGEILFRITRPAIYGSFAIVDLTYYQKNGLPSVEQWYQGQALLVFQKKLKKDWQLIRIVNRFIL